MTETTITGNRTYKARIFEMVFSSKKELLALYNAVNGICYTDPEQLEIKYLNISPLTVPIFPSVICSMYQICIQE